jgi:hypothetical protein
VFTILGSSFRQVFRYSECSPSQGSSFRLIFATHHSLGSSF